MKTLNQMDNLDRAYLLANLFPDELKNMIDFIKKEADFCQDNKEQILKDWTAEHITAELWYNLIAFFERRYKKNGTRLYRNKKTFRDQLFDGYDALFSINALIKFTAEPQCSKKLKYAIYLLFGDNLLVKIDLQSEP
ncbi:hypothetical protein EG359_05785 [Chryseobacterium joostei]|uniref:Uncharacterized protein n=1 Tax=Chryseobacterium joostei TaxID=112234 RepID=A0A1N7HTP4_9FLAO|nr:hypothetical protein [Chryseobacterium joostei]AZA99142.1 hypothetical protein EG359_05785 [Chryseobacterium joostei]SIS28193.1 hypothetical protein SAMN05421768_101202 [Chryseobacterium joostei]